VRPDWPPLPQAGGQPRASPRLPHRSLPSARPRRLVQARARLRLRHFVLGERPVAAVGGRQLPWHGPRDRGVLRLAPLSTPWRGDTSSPLLPLRLDSSPTRLHLPPRRALPRTAHGMARWRHLSHCAYDPHTLHRRQRPRHCTSYDLHPSLSVLSFTAPPRFRWTKRRQPVRRHS